jgi:NH3-dependent NAD+ synthetase
MPFRRKLRPHFTPIELEQIADLMLERGFRVRCPTADYWSATDPNDEADLPVDEELADDELYFLTEAHESRPY